MKRYIIYILFLAVTFTCCGQTRMSGKKFKKFSNVTRVDSPIAYIMGDIGQSNAGTFTGNVSGFYTGNPFKTKHFDSVSNSFPVYTANGNEVGYETQAAALQAAIRNDTILIVRVYLGSQDIYQWSKTDNASMWVRTKRNIDSANAVIRRMGKRPVWLSILWMHGEQNITANTPQATYQAKEDSLITNIRGLDPSMSNTQWVMGKIRSDQTWSVNSASIVNTSIDNLVSTRTNCTSIDPVAIGATYGSAPHYGSVSYILIANAWSGLIQ